MLNNTNALIRINITIPKKLILELDKEVPKRGKSNFITAAIEEKLIRERRKETLENLKSISAAFQNVKDSVSYVNEMRSKDEKKREE